MWWTNLGRIPNLANIFQGVETTTESLVKVPCSYPGCRGKGIGRAPWNLQDQLQVASAICMKLHQNSYIFCRYRPANYLLKRAGNDRPPRNVIIWLRSSRGGLCINGYGRMVATCFADTRPVAAEALMSRVFEACEDAELPEISWFCLSENASVSRLILMESCFRMPLV